MIREGFKLVFLFVLLIISYSIWLLLMDGETSGVKPNTIRDKDTVNDLYVDLVDDIDHFDCLKCTNLQCDPASSSLLTLGENFGHLLSVQSSYRCEAV